MMSTALILYMCGVLLYASIYGADVIIALVARRHVPAVAIPMAPLIVTAERALNPIRLAAIFAIIAFTATRSFPSMPTLLAVMAILCLVARWSLAPSDPERYLGRGIPVLGSRAFVSATGLFALIAAGLTH